MEIVSAGCKKKSATEACLLSGEFCWRANARQQFPPKSQQFSVALFLLTLLVVTGLERASPNTSHTSERCKVRGCFARSGHHRRCLPGTLYLLLILTAHSFSSPNLHYSLYILSIIYAVFEKDGNFGLIQPSSTNFSLGALEEESRRERRKPTVAVGMPGRCVLWVLCYRCPQGAKNTGVLKPSFLLTSSSNTGTLFMMCLWDCTGEGEGRRRGCVGAGERAGGGAREGG